MTQRPVLIYFGGKARLAPKLLPYFPSHHTFVDVFGGSGAVLLAKPKSKIEVFNDIDQQLINFYKVVRDPKLLRRLIKALEMTLVSRAEFELAQTPTDEPVEAARRLLVRNRQSFSGLGKSWSYTISDVLSKTSNTVRRWQIGLERLLPAHQRLQAVQIECLDFRNILKKYDAPETLFYLDPPYVSETRVDGGYRADMTLQDHIDLVRLLQTLKGQAVISGYEHLIYQPLEQAGWKKIDFEVLAFSSVHRTRRTESIWCSPVAEVTAESNRVDPTPNFDQVQPRLKGRDAGAKKTHKIRTTKTEEKIKQAIAFLLSRERKVSAITVAAQADISREHLTRRYGHLIGRGAKKSGPKT